MRIITISRGSFSHGKEIAEKVAETLGYGCVSREILLEASQYFKVSEDTLFESIHDAPSMLERFTHGREKYIDYIRTALLEHVKKDNIVYHGHAGHLLIPEIAHVLKVRIIADLEERVALVKQRKKMSTDKALAYVKDMDKNRAKWTRYLYKVDINDPRLYDIIVNIGSMRIEDACEIICSAARCGTFETTPEDKRAFDDLALQAHVSTAIQKLCKAEVTSRNGVVHIKVAAQRIKSTSYSSPQKQAQVQEALQIGLTKDITEVVMKIPDVKYVTCDVERPYFA